MPTVNLQPLDFLLMAAYVVAVVGWGLWHAKRQNAEGYFLGGRQMPWPVIGLSMIAMCVSSSSLVGWSADAYDTGIAVFNYGMAGAIVPIVFFVVFFLPFYLRNNIFTLPEFLEGRYDGRSRFYLSVVTVLGYTFADAAVTLYAGALMLQLVVPSVGLAPLVWAIAVVAASYTLIGGLSSVMWVDIVQAIVLLGGSTALTVIAFSEAGGWGAVMSQVPEGHLHLLRPADDASVPWPTLIITLPMLGFYFWGLSQAMVQRTLSAKSIDHGRWGSLLAAALNFLVFFVMVLPGLAGRVLYPELETPNQVYPKMVFELLPVGVTGVVVVGFLAAMVSTLSSILNSAQTLVTMDLVNKLRPGLSSQQLVRVGNVAGIAIIAVAALWAPQIQSFGSVIKYFQQLLSYMAPPIVAVFVLGLFWRKATATAAFSALLAGLAVAVTLLLVKQHTPLAEMHFLYVAPLLFATSVAFLVVVSYVTNPPTAEAVERFVWRPAYFAAESEQLVGVSPFKNYRILSAALLAFSAAFFILWR
ncbi:MAG: sodium/solute symporter [Planctomycetota bacterium]